MSNLNIGDVVYHKGQKRTVELNRAWVGGALLKLSGVPYLVRARDVKPVVRLTDLVRAMMLVSAVGKILSAYNGEGPWVSVTVGSSPFKITREDFEDATCVISQHYRDRVMRQIRHQVGINAARMTK